MRVFIPAALGIGSMARVETIFSIEETFDVSVPFSANMALRGGIIATTIGYEEPNPDCALNVVPNVTWEVKVALSNAFAFGGLNAVLACGKCKAPDLSGAPCVSPRWPWRPRRIRP